MSDTEEDPAAAARAEVIEAFERSAEVYGVSRSYGRLYGVLFFADEPLSLDELVERSGYAKSTASSALRRLDRLHLVRRRSVAGEGKKAYYEAERDFWRVVQELLRNEVMREISIMQRSLASAADRLEAAEGERAERDLEKVRSLARLYDRSERMVEVVTRTSFERLAEVVRRLAS